jgi:hypothetical protein
LERANVTCLISRCLPAAALAAVGVLNLGGCSTHDQKYDSLVPPPYFTVDDDRAATAAATGIVDRYRNSATTLPAGVLAPLAQAAALTYRRTHAIATRAAAVIYANQLLSYAVPTRVGTAFGPGGRKPQPDPELTAAVGDALLDVYLATRETAYALAVIGATDAIASRELGWTPMWNGFAVRGKTGAPEVALTAGALSFLDRVQEAVQGKRVVATDGRVEPPVRLPGASPRLGVRLSGEVDAAFKVLAAAQQSVGRWYAEVGGRRPMNLDQWATTLHTFARFSRRQAQGIAGGGIPELWSAAFSSDGRPVSNALTRGGGRGVARSFIAFEAWGDLRYGQAVFRHALTTRQPDGTIGLAAPGDAASQADFAVAFARRALAIKERE